jgi:hypothetical protein
MTGIPTCPQCGHPHIAVPHGGPACAAHKSAARGGGPCHNAPASGQAICRYHGGAAALAKAAAEVRLAEAEANRVLGLYSRTEMDIDPGEALLDLICWGHAKVGFYRKKALALDPADVIWGITKRATGGKDKGDTFESKPNAWVVLLREAEVDLARYCVDALKVGLKQRELDIAARMADKIMPILDAVLNEFGHDPALPEVAEKVERILRAV